METINKLKFFVYNKFNTIFCLIYFLIYYSKINKSLSLFHFSYSTSFFHAISIFSVVLPDMQMEENIFCVFMGDNLKCVALGTVKFVTGPHKGSFIGQSFFSPHIQWKINDVILLFLLLLLFPFDYFVCTWIIGGVLVTIDYFRM